MQVLNGPPQQRCAQDAIWYFGLLLLALLVAFGGLVGHVEEGVVDVALEMRAEPGLEVCAASWDNGSVRATVMGSAARAYQLFASGRCC